MIRKDPAKSESNSSGLIPRSHVRMGTDLARVGQPKVEPVAQAPSPLAPPKTEPTASEPINHEEHDEPQVRLIRDGDTVCAIEVICSCGRHTVLNCVY